MTRRARLVAACCVALLVLALCPRAQATMVKKLGNGLTLVARQDSDSATFGLSILIRATGYDDLDKPGVRNIMARALFSGSTAQPSGDLELLQRARDMGGGVAAYTESDHIEIFAFGPMLLFSELLDYVGHCCTSPTFPPDGIAAAIRAAKAAIEERDAGVVTTAFEKARKLLYPVFPMHDTLGTVQSVDEITREDVLAAAKRLLVGRRMVAALVAPLPEPQLIAELERRLAALPPGEPYQPPNSEELMLAVYGSRELAPLKFRSRVETNEHAQAAVICLAYRVPAVGEEGWATAELAAALLGASRFGRLTTDPWLDMRTVGIACLAMRQLDHNVLLAYAGTSVRIMEQVRARMVRAIASLATGEVTVAELARAREYVVGSEKMAQLTTHEQAREMAWGVLAGLGPDVEAALAQAVNSVSREDIRLFAEKWLADEKRGMVVLLPRPKFDPSLIQFPGLRREGEG